MQVYWNARQMGQVFVLPAEVAQQHLRLAGPVQLKVLLWVASQGAGIFDAAACARAIGRSEADCEDALQYWLETGVLCSDVHAPAVAAPAPAAVPPAEEVPKRPMAVPRAVKPQMDEVIRRQSESEDIAVLFDSVSARLGKPLSPSDMETLVYLYDTAGLPVEVILMVVGYAAEQGKLSMRYIEKTALGWADQGVTDIITAEQYLCNIEKHRTCAEKIQQLFGLQAPLTRAQSAQAVQWLTEWEMSDELLCLAHRQCVEKTGKCQFNYIHKVLAHWYADGVTDPQQVTAAPSKPSAPVRKTASIDTEEYERQILQHIPVFKKRKV